MIAFKIVQNLGNGELWSYMTSLAAVRDFCFVPTPTELRYFPGHTTRPLFGKLFVLDSLRNAEAMLANHRNMGLEIWTADVYDEEPLDRANFENPKSFWASGNSSKAQLPTGTLVCNAVTLRERVA